MSSISPISPNKIIWTRDMTITLIELLEDSPPLWDVSIPNYKNRNKRDECLKEISEKMNIPVSDIKSKILKLRTQYSNEKIKMRKAKTRTGKPYVTRWEYFSLLKFLFKHEEKNTHPVEILDTEFYEEMNTDSEFDETDESFIICDEKPIDTKPFKTIKLSDADLQEINFNRVPVISNAKTHDEFNTFGDFVANELRNLKTTPDLQYKLKTSIQRAILDVTEEYINRVSIQWS